MKPDIDTWITEQLAIAEKATPGPLIAVRQKDNKFHPEAYWSTTLETADGESTLACAAALHGNDFENFTLFANARTGYPRALKMLRLHRELVKSLFDKIKHGDAVHQAWLDGAIEDHFKEAIAYDPDVDLEIHE